MCSVEVIVDPRANSAYALQLAQRPVVVARVMPPDTGTTHWCHVATGMAGVVAWVASPGAYGAPRCRLKLESEADSQDCVTRARTRITLPAPEPAWLQRRSEQADLPPEALLSSAELARDELRVADNVDLAGLMRFDMRTATDWNCPLTEFSADGHVQHEALLCPHVACVVKVAGCWQLRGPVRLRYREAAARSRGF